jgi:hypothetical protein
MSVGILRKIVSMAVSAAFFVGAEPSLRAMPLSVALTPVRDAGLSWPAARWKW